MMRKLLLIVTLISASELIYAQTDTILFSELSQYTFVEPPFKDYSAFTSIFNSNGDPFMYSACRELGIVTFDVSDISDPHPVDTVPQIAFNDLKPTNVSQTGNYLFASLGGYDLFTQPAGLAILDISDPAHPEIMDQWDSTAFNQGAGIAISDGEYAYLGAMDRGVVILDVHNKSNIKYISSILPDPNFPEPPGLFSVPNARGLALYEDDKLMVAYDAGGLRMIDISDRENPVEIGKYANSMIEDSAQSAYNNILIVDHYAYVPVDMCGLDVVDIADETMETVVWINPWDCDSTNWIGRPGHTNEIKRYGDDLIFVSGGDTEVLTFDISNREAPVLVGEYAHVPDSIVAWALDVKDNIVSLALVHNESGVPYYSNQGGIKMLEMEIIPVVGIEDHASDHFESFISPNPCDELLNINLDVDWATFEIIEITGRKIMEGKNSQKIELRYLNPGCYFLLLFNVDHHLIADAEFIRQ